MIRSVHILPFVFLALLTGAVVVVKAHRATPRIAEAAEAQPVAPIGNYAPIGVLQSPPSLSAAQIDGILAEYSSPAQGSGKDFYDLGVEWGIDPAYALAFFVHESRAGTDPRWDGIKPDGTTTHDIGNISCGGGFACYGRWRDYPDWRTGIDDWYRLIRVEYIEGRDHTTVDDVIPVYAPAMENDVGGYTNTVNALVDKWRNQYQQPQQQGGYVIGGPDIPGIAPGQIGAPVPIPHTQAGKCGFTDTNAVPADSTFWSTGSGYWGGQYGGMHLGDDFVGNPGDPVYAPWDMTIDSVGEYTDPGRFGKNIQAHIVSDGVLFYAGHLIDVYVQAGDVVPACTQIGTLGAIAGNPHTHIKMASPGAPIPCEGSEPGNGGCIDPLEYWETH